MLYYAYVISIPAGHLFIYLNKIIKHFSYYGSSVQYHVEFINF